jgi:hypothetical protein
VWHANGHGVVGAARRLHRRGVAGSGDGGRRWCGTRTAAGWCGLVVDGDEVSRPGRAVSGCGGASGERSWCEWGGVAVTAGGERRAKRRREVVAYGVSAGRAAGDSAPPN